MDVVAVVSAWLARSQPLGRSLGGANSETARHSLAWVLFFLGLHDLGKLDVRFQAKAPEAIRALKTYHPYPEFLWLKIPTRNYRHGPEGFRWGMAELPDYIGFDRENEDAWYDYGEAWKPWLSAVTGHHGVLPEAADYGLHGVIYANHRVLWRTEQRLQRANGQVTFPEAYRDWIEAVYAEEGWPDEPESILNAYDDFMAEQWSQAQAADSLVNTRMEPFKDENNKIRVLTRDGEQQLNVLPVQSTADGLALLDGGLLNQLSEWEKAEILNQQTATVPNSWNQWLPPADDAGLHILTMEPIEEGIWEVFLDSSRLRYSRALGLEREKI